MIDHTGERHARATESLASLGISIIMEVSAAESGHGAAVGFGANFKLFFWIVRLKA